MSHFFSVSIPYEYLSMFHAIFGIHLHILYFIWQPKPSPPSTLEMKLLKLTKEMRFVTSFQLVLFLLNGKLRRSGAVSGGSLLRDSQLQTFFQNQSQDQIFT